MTITTADQLYEAVAATAPKPSFDEAFSHATSLLPDRASA